jgi:hypothetical protein
MSNAGNDKAGCLPSFFDVPVLLGMIAQFTRVVLVRNSAFCRYEASRHRH